jgi:hypothetical protein
LAGLVGCSEKEIEEFVDKGFLVSSSFMGEFGAIGMFL